LDRAQVKSAALAPAIAAPVQIEAPVQAISGNVVKSPIVGTFYAAPAPDKPPFVTVGSSVKKGDVLFIIESMKLMNEVTSEYDGTVREIFAQNGGSVEYGQAVMSIG
jgi:acetyl-CoA carboxylase biotin carboxyl carrier protein